MRSSPKVSVLCVEGEYMVIRIYNSDTITNAKNRTIKTADFLEWISGLSVSCAEIAIEDLKPALERGDSIPANKVSSITERLNAITGENNE